MEQTQPKPLKELIAEQTGPAVENASNDLTETFKTIDGMLRKRELHIQQALMQMLGSAVQVREMEMKNALSEYQNKIAFERQRVQAQQDADLAKAQAAVAEANKPKLVVPGVQ